MLFFLSVSGLGRPSCTAGKRLGAGYMSQPPDVCCDTTQQENFVATKSSAFARRTKRNTRAFHRNQKPPPKRGPHMEGFMRNTRLDKEIRNMTDTELDREWSRAYHLVYGESFGSDCEAHANAIRRFKALDTELRQRRQNSVGSNKLVAIR